jgi:hypothetical protein
MAELIRDLEKHPLVAGGGPLKVGIRAVGENTAVAMHNPLAMPSSARAATPPPVMDRRGPLSATQARRTPSSSSTSVHTPPPPDVEARSEPGDVAPAAAPAPAAKAPREGFGIPWGGITTFIIALLLAGAAWVNRDAIIGWADKNAPDKNRLVAIWLGIEAEGAHQLGPILKTIHIDADPKFVFDLLAVLVLLLVLRNIYASIVRSRNRRAYLRAQARNPS